ncbi:MAG: nucleotidyl transferase AbiEii/AbiGii toxin family protein, partial [Patescibacteria group bacterium]
MMQTNNREDNVHKAWLYRLLEAIASDSYLSSVLYFKGGTCASMLGWLDRFSVDLDFDYAGDTENIKKTKDALEKVFASVGLSIKDKSQNGIQYFLRY